MILRLFRRKARRIVRDTLRLAGVLKDPQESLKGCEVAVVSLAKSGRTWLRAIIGHALVDALGLPPENLLDTAALTRAAGLKLTLFTHDGSQRALPRNADRVSPDKSAYRDIVVHFLHRDLRDVLVSAWFQITKRANVYDGTLGQYIRDPVMGARVLARFSKDWERAAAVPKEFHLIRYEQLHADPAPAVRRILDSMGASVSDAQLQRAIAASTFEKMRQMEESGIFKGPGNILLPGDINDGESYKVRRGIVGGYKDYMSEADIAYVDRIVAEEGDPFGTWRDC